MTQAPVKPDGFRNEDALQESTFEALLRDPAFLPLSGEPKLAPLGREVRLGSGPLDLLAIESEGRPVVIEAKLARNPEARRKVVAQTLDYAAYLHGLPTQDFERIVLPHLRKRGVSSLADAVAGIERGGAFNHEAFQAELERRLTAGSFRLVFLLDQQAPTPLLKLANYLDASSESLTVDITTVTVESDGQTLVAQRVDHSVVPPWEPGRIESTPNLRRLRELIPGSTHFRESLSTAVQADISEELANWADALDDEEICRLNTSSGGGKGVVLLLYLPCEKRMLVKVERGKLWLNGDVVKRTAPDMAPEVARLSGVEIGKRGFAKTTSEELRDALTEAYIEAAGHD